MTLTLTTGDRVIVALAAALHVGIAIFPLSASGLVAPGWFLALTAAVWLGGAVVLWRLARSAPRLAWLVSPVVLTLWVVGILIGDRLLGWTA